MKIETINSLEKYVAFVLKPKTVEEYILSVMIEIMNSEVSEDKDRMNYLINMFPDIYRKAKIKAFI